MPWMAVEGGRTYTALEGWFAYGLGRLLDGVAASLRRVVPRERSARRGRRADHLSHPSGRGPAAGQENRRPGVARGGR